MRIFFTFLILCLSFSTIKAQTTEDYIAEHFSHAQALMRLHHLPASIILGVAIHESAAGKSKIAKYLNNHFGVKGNNSSKEIQSAYRDYPSVDSSYNHFVSFLQSRTYFNVLFSKYDRYDFTNWARGIQRGGYAHSRTWSAQVIALINKYELFKYDERPLDYMAPPILIEPKSITKSKVKIEATKSKVYAVKKGDNLNNIAEKMGTTSAALMKKNNLKSVTLQPGQEIKL